MKQILLVVIAIYQVTLSPLLKSVLGISRMCRYTPSCSEYTKQSIATHGIIVGSILGGKRLLTCW